MRGGTRGHCAPVNRPAATAACSAVSRAADADPGQRERRPEHDDHRAGHREQQVSGHEGGDPGGGDQERAAPTEPVGEPRTAVAV